MLAQVAGVYGRQLGVSALSLILEQQRYSLRREGSILQFRLPLGDAKSRIFLPRRLPGPFRRLGRVGFYGCIPGSLG